MKTDHPALRIAVIGAGPRSLGALEALAADLREEQRAVQIDTFDPFPANAAGPNFDPEESPLCLLNTAMRDIDIRAPQSSNCGAFADWLAHDPDPDSFPLRADLGRYLEARHTDLAAQGHPTITRVFGRADDLRPNGDGWEISLHGQWLGPYDEVLLTPGQPASTPDDQLSDWQNHAARSGAILANAYPARNLARAAEQWGDKTVAIRGMGLSVFDVLRVLTTGLGGRFENGQYIASGREPARILPFSLDGKPPFPKPETGDLDARFTPQKADTEAFCKAMAIASSSATDKARELLNAATIPAVRHVLDQHGVTKSDKDIADWLDKEWVDPGSQSSDGPRETLKAGIELASGQRAPDIGFAFGQIWRKWQDEIRAAYNPIETPPDTAEKIVGFDEGLKRYSYGQPISSAREMEALIEAGIVDLGHAADPQIDLTPSGWQLTSGDRQTEVSVMVDSVLPSPNLSITTDPLICGLMENGKLTEIAKGMGARTAPDGTVIDVDGTPIPHLCLLGRMSLGSVIAADSLHDCFGEAANRWARGVAERLKQKSDKEPA
ncbi:MAG: FAD/NAD(P)-binding protein [Heliomarina sp.]|uniref:FAD/NAD(P)-binding protein n=1 Tax=Heliomarina sp. TaxID=2917556 RepID=UPI00405A2FF1